MRKVSARDLAGPGARALDGATTVAASLALCTAAGIDVFATGGIGGVHREPPFDESADLLELARTPVVTVCAGAKSILDLPATLERLESYGVAVIGFGTDEFPGFFTRRTGLPRGRLDRRSREIARAFRAHRALGRPEAMLVVQPPPADSALDENSWKMRPHGARRGGAWLASPARRSRRSSWRPSSAKPGALTGANLALLEANAALAGQIAVALREDG